MRSKFTHKSLPEICVLDLYYCKSVNGTLDFYVSM